MKNRKTDLAGMWLCAGILSALTFLMVKVEMGKGYEVLLYSDFATHSSWAVGEFTDPLYDKFYAYPVWHLLVRGINWILPIGREYAGALVTACCIGGAAALLYKFLWLELKGCLSERKICLLAVGLMVLTALYMPWFNVEPYLGQTSPTTWHNPTNMAVKPVALLAFLWFLKLYLREQKVKAVEFAGLSGLLLFSCFVKPSFVQGFLPAVVLFLLVELYRTKGKSFLFSLKMAAVFIPSGIYFLVTFFSMFGVSAERSIGISPFEVLKLDAAHPLISILQTIAFPLFVLCILGGRQIWQDKSLLFSLAFDAASLLEYILLIEVTEPESGNFEWALQLALFTLFAMTALRFYQKKDKKPWMDLAGNGLLLYHVLSGIFYYVYLLISPLQC